MNHEAMQLEATWSTSETAPSPSLSLSSDSKSVSGGLPLLSASECAAIIHSMSTEFCTQSVHESQRQVHRLCVLDETFASLLWLRLQSAGVFSSSSSVTHCPYGFHTSDPLNPWVLHGVNPCIRLSKYDTSSIGFLPHFDIQYHDYKTSNNHHHSKSTDSGDNNNGTDSSVELRSVYTVVIYLNDDFIGGNTIFYTPINAGNTVSALTVRELIDLNGGLDNGYSKRTILPSTGTGIIFPHTFLHEATGITSGSKYVLRADVVCKRRLSLLPSSSSLSSSSSASPSLLSSRLHTTPLLRDIYRVCTEIFLQAEQYELNGHTRHAEELYQRASAINRHAQQHQTTASLSSADAFSFVVHQDVWCFALSHLSLEDLHAFSCGSRVCRALERRVYAMLWRSYRCDVPKTISSSLPSESYIPQLVGHFVNKLVFVFSKDVYKKHKEACLRVLTVAALFYHSNAMTDTSYVAHYDSERGRVLRCSKEALFACAFYELPCNGMFFRCPTQRVYDQSADHWDAFRTLSTKLPSFPTLDNDEPYSMSVADAFQTYVDHDFLSVRMNSNEKSMLSSQQVHLDHHIDGVSARRRYIADCNANTHHTSNVSYICRTVYQRQITTGCGCGNGEVDDVERTANFSLGYEQNLISYNNLVADFRTHKLKIRTETQSSKNTSESSSASSISTTTPSSSSISDEPVRALYYGSLSSCIQTPSYHHAGECHCDLSRDIYVYRSALEFNQSHAVREVEISEISLPISLSYGSARCSPLYHMRHVVDVPTGLDMNQHQAFLTDYTSITL